jgi:hypothetical protein
MFSSKKRPVFFFQIVEKHQQHIDCNFFRLRC